MAEVARGDVEILVHITAPSNARDDARHRALAQSYLDFQPYTRRRLDIVPQDDIEDAVEEVADRQLQGELQQSTQEERESRASYQPDEEEGETGSKHSTGSAHYQSSSDRQDVTDFPLSSQLSFRSVADNVHSPALQFRRQSIHASAGERHLRSSADSWGAAPSTVADSQPEGDVRSVLEASPTGILESYLRLTQVDGSSPDLPVHRLRTEAAALRVAVGAEEVEGSEDMGVPSSPSPQKRSQTDTAGTEVNRGGLPPQMREPILPLKRRLDDSSADYGSSPSLPSMMPPRSTAERQPRSSKRQRVEPPSSQLSSYTKVTKINMPLDPNSSMVSNADTSDWADLIEIRPKPPLTGTGDLTADMLITDSLSSLKTRISSRGHYPYVPQSQIRELRPMERGYWLVDSAKWDISIRSRCWNYLGKYVGMDLAGWAVACHRDTTETNWIRVYCSGVVVEHIYLLLFMASTSKIKGTGARWIGGDGTTIITMPS